MNLSPIALAITGHDKKDKTFISGKKKKTKNGHTNQNPRKTNNPFELSPLERKPPYVSRSIKKSAVGIVRTIHPRTEVRY